MSEESPNQTASATSVLMVGLMSDVVARVAAFVALRGVHARATTLAKLHADAAFFAPLVVLVDGYLYDFDPVAFDKLAQNIGAKLGVVNSVKDAEELIDTALRPTTRSTTHASNEVQSTSGSRNFETAKIDAKTLHESLERMVAKHAGLTTAKYDQKTLREALERMNSTDSDLGPSK